MRTVQKTIHHNIGGRKRPDFARVATKTRMAKYMRLSQLPVPPDSFDYFAIANAAAEADILGNDSLGDCTSAGACHLAEIYSAGGGAPAVLTRAQAIAFYSLSTGYVPGNPSTDQGGDEVTVLTDWKLRGLDGKGLHAIKDFIAVDGKNAAEVLAANWLFGGTYFGLELTDAMANTSAGNFEWKPGTANPNDGHCVVGGGGDKVKGIKINTWALLGFLEMDAIAELCVESAGGTVFVPISQEWVNAAKGMAPSGFDWQQLADDFDLDLGGSVPVPPTPPAPPGGAATLANANAAIQAAFQGTFVYDQAQAIARAQGAVGSLTWP